jgi:hypothetical protein
MGEKDLRENHAGDSRTDRRDFMRRAAALGVAAGVAEPLLKKPGIAAAPSRRRMQRSGVKTLVVAAVNTPVTP